MPSYNGLAMPAAPPLPVTPALISWARQESGYSPAAVAKRLGVTEERLLAWERGERQPTIRQVEKLAHALRRPLSIFFLHRPPRIPPLATEYRRLPGVRPGHESPELRLALRQMLTRRENAINLLGELGQPVPEFRLRAHLDEPPGEVGRRLRDARGIDIAAQVAWPDAWRAWAGWRTAAERLGVLVFVFSRVALDEVRGLALLRAPLPVAAINGKEIPETKIYTLLHEVVHLMLAASNQEAPAMEDTRPAREWAGVERFAEVAASHALIPEDGLQAAVLSLARPASWDIAAVRRIARRFRVTPLAVATRLRESGFMTWEAYRHWRAAWDEYVKALPPRKGGFASPAEKAVNRAGRPFAQLVLEALSANRITSLDAARYLELKFDHFDELRSNLAAPREALPAEGRRP